MEKKRAKPLTKAQQRKDLYYKLRGTIPTSALKRLTLEEMQRHWEKDAFLNPEAKKRKESEKEKEKKEEKEKKKDKKEEKDESDIDDLKRDEAQLDALLVVKEDGAEKVEPIATDLPRIVDWRVIEILEPRKMEMINVIREDGSVTLFKSFQEIVKKVRYDGKKFDRILTKIIWDWVKMMFEPAEYLLSFSTFKSTSYWRYFARTGVHQVTLDGGELIFMLTDRIYDMNLSLLMGMIRCKLVSGVKDEVAKSLLYMVLNQIHKKEQAGKKKKK